MPHTVGDQEGTRSPNTFYLGRKKEDRHRKMLNAFNNLLKSSAQDFVQYKNLRVS